MFCSGTKELVTPRLEAVAGMSCMRPWAPARETARALPFDSAWTIDARRSASMLWVAPARVRSWWMSVGSGEDAVATGEADPSAALRDDNKGGGSGMVS